MVRPGRRWQLAAVWAALAWGVGAAADEPKPAKPGDWSAYATGTTVAGTVEEVTETALTLKVAGYAPGGRRPKAKTEEYELTFAPQALVRWHKAPVEKDEKGNKKPLSPSRHAQLKQPPGAPGWAAARDDLQAGQVVEVTLVRPKEVPASKAQYGDLRVKYVVIHGEAPAAPEKGGAKKK